MKQIDKFIDKYGSMFDPLAFQFDGVTYITHQNKDGTISYHQIISSTDKERTVAKLAKMYKMSDQLP